MIVQHSVSGRVLGSLVVLALVGVAYGQTTKITSTGSVDPSYTSDAPLNTPVLKVGISAYGEVSVTGGGQVTAGSAYIAGVPSALGGPDETEQGPDGLVTVAGSGSFLTTIVGDNDGDLFVGYTGEGTLSVESDAQVTTGGLVIGGGPEAVGNVFVGSQTLQDPGVPDNARVDVEHKLLVGVWANVANLTIRNGGQVTAGELQVGGMENDEATSLPLETRTQLESERANGSVTVENGSALDVSGPAYIGYSDTGTVNVTTGGTVTTNQTAVGLGPISTGTLTVDGANGGAEYNVTYDADYETASGLKSGALIVGAYGTGVMTVKNGGQVRVGHVTGAGDDIAVDHGTVYVGGFMLGELPFTDQIDGQDLDESPNGTGTLTIQDHESSLTTNVLAVGATGHGILDLHGDDQGTAYLTTTEAAGIGVAAGSQGDVTVGNAGSWANAGSMYVGGYGTGTLTIQSGGHVDGGNVLYIGGYDPEDITNAALNYGDQPNGTGTVTVTGSGATLEAFGIGVGVKQGTGTLQIQNGGRVDSQVGVVASSTGSTGTVIVDGVNSLWKLSGDDELPEGLNAAGGGTVTVSAGGTIQVDGSKAVLLVGTADDGGQVTVGSTGQGTVTLANGGSVQSGELIIGGTLPPGEVTAEQLQAGGFDTGTGTVEITGADSHWQTGEGDVVVGFAGTGTLNVTDGQVTSRAGWIGVTPDAIGTATIRGTTETPTAAWTNQETLAVGAWGTGTLNIEHGAHVSASEASVGGLPLAFLEESFDPDLLAHGTGTVNVTGSGSTLDVTSDSTLYVGYSGTGTLNVLDQGQVNTESVVIGAGLDAVGTVTVDGEHSQMTVGNDAIVGAWGEGHLTISDQGQVETQGLYLGGLTASQVENVDPEEAIRNAFGDPTGTGVVTITGAESSVTTDTLAVGVTGTGTLNLLDDASLTTQEAGIGVAAGSHGDVVVSNAPDSWTNSGSMFVGGYGTGTLTIEPSGHVDAGNVLYIGGYNPSDFTSEILAQGDHANGTGTVTVAGDGTAPDSPQLEAFGIAVGMEGTGTLQIQNGGRVDSEIGVVGAMTGGMGTVTVDGAHSLWNLHGTATWPGGFDPLTEPQALGTGTVTVSNGGTIAVGTDDEADSKAALIVANKFFVGSTGLNNRVSVANGGLVQSGELVIGGTTLAQDTTPQEYMAAYEAHELGTGTGQVDITGATSLWQAQESPVFVGFSGNGTLNVTDARLESQSGWIANMPNVTGTATISGATAQWINEGTLSIGMWGAGTLNVQDGAHVSASEASIGGAPFAFLHQPFDVDFLATGTGTVNVTGAGSTLTVTGTETLYVGYSGTGELNVQEQGQVNTESIVIGAGPDVVGTVNVDGDVSKMTVTDDATVGAWGEGHLTISNQGQVTADSLHIGGLTDSQLEGVDQAIRDAFLDPKGTGFVTVTGNGSTLNVASNNTLVVGTRGTGTLTIEDQGAVTAQDSFIGYLAGSSGTLAISGAGQMTSNNSSLGYSQDSTGTANVTGAGSQWQTGDLVVGWGGTGTLNINQGGQVASSDGGFIGFSEDSIGTVNVAGTDSTWNVGGDLFVGGSSTAAGGTGTLAVTDGGLVDVTGEMTVWETGTLRGNGTVTVQTDDTLHNYGTISPGTPSAIGTLTVNGNVVFEPGSTYAVKIDQTTSDKLEVNGDTTINGGTVKISSLGTVVGSHDYEILTADSITGTFDVLDTALLTFSVSDPALSYDPTAINLHISAANFDDPTIAQTPNQRAVGGGLQQIADTGGSDVTGALQQVDTPEDLRHAYDQLSGQSRPPLAPLAATGTSRFMGTVSDRVQSLQTGVASTMSNTSLFALSGPDSRTGNGRMSESAAGGQSVAVGNGSNILADSPWGLWGRGYGLFGDRETEQDAPGYTYHMYGGSLGLDYQFTETFLGGVVFGVTNGDVDFAGMRDTADLEVYHVGLYGNLTSGKWYLNSMATYGHVQYDTERFVDLTSERLTGDLNGNDWSAYVEAGQNLPLGPQTVLQPLASLQYSYLGLDSYTETGGVSALSYDDQSYQSVKGSLGARLTRQLFESVSGCRGDGQLRARWVHEFGDSQSSVDTSFASNPAAVFTIRDAEIARDSAVVGAGLGVNLTKQLRASADYDALLNVDETVQMVSAALEYRW